jgi:DNA-directed RNA polymerase specialized sigma24 family protein
VSSARPGQELDTAGRDRFLLLNTVRPHAVNLLRHCGATMEQSEDIVQEAMIELALNGRWEERGCSAATALFSRSHCRLIDEFRREGVFRMKMAKLADYGHVPCISTSCVENVELVATIRSLSPSQRNEVGIDLVAPWLRDDSPRAKTARSKGLKTLRTVLEI